MELTTAGEKEEKICNIISSAHKILRNNEVKVFIPAISQQVRNDFQTLFYMSGYIFIEFNPSISYTRLRDTQYFKDVLCSSEKSGKPHYCLLEDIQLDPIRKGMKDLKSGAYQEGDEVLVKKGQFKGLPGVISIVYEDGERVQVSVAFPFGSKRLLVDYPVTYIEKI